MSDSVLNGDLFRFYKNPDFKKVNPGKYEYKSGPKGNEKIVFQGVEIVKKLGHNS